MILDKSHLLSNVICNWKRLFIQELWFPYFVKGNKGLVVMETWLLPMRNTQFVCFLGIVQTPENTAGAEFSKLF